MKAFFLSLFFSLVMTNNKEVLVNFLVVIDYIPVRFLWDAKFSAYAFRESVHCDKKSLVGERNCHHGVQYLEKGNAGTLLAFSFFFSFCQGPQTMELLWRLFSLVNSFRKTLHRHNQKCVSPIAMVFQNSVHLISKAIMAIVYPVTPLCQTP